MDKMNKMRNNRRCIIYGCNSSSLKDKELKFFRFPRPTDREYQPWLNVCKDSYNQIRVLKKPLICSRHFVPEDVGGRRLNPGAFPRLRLSISKESLDFKQREQKIKFLNKVMQLWFLRNRPYREIYGQLLIDMAVEARDLLDIDNYVPDNSWLHNFNLQLATVNSSSLQSKARGTSLSIAGIITDLKKFEEKSQSLQHDVQENSIEISDDDDDYDDGDFSDGQPDVSPKLEDSDKADEDSEHYEPIMKMPKFESILLDLDEDENPEKPDKNSIVSYKGALDYMKPLEDFILMKEDFRALGLLTQLEALFKKEL